METTGAGSAGGGGSAPPRVTFERQYRTAQSEGYHVLVGDQRLAHLDLHFTQTNVYGTLVLEAQVPEDQILDLIDRIDESIVLSAEGPREDLLVTVYQGTRSALYSDDYLEERRQRQGITDGGRAGRASRQRNVN
jgi:hypothetical protein